jgi:two-component system NtrC family sensor kinase
MNERIRILCVDDERNVLKALERVFMDDEYEIITADTGEEGLVLLEEGEPVQVVVSDYRMPVKCGIDFLKEVYRRWPDTERIVLSGYADTGAVVDAVNECHIYKFITKPWNDDELKVTISSALERYFLKKSNHMKIEELQTENSELARINRDLEGIVAELTAKITLLGREGEAFPGNGRRGSLSAEVNEFVDALQQGRATADALRINSEVLKMMGAVMKRHDQEGIIPLPCGEARNVR